MNSHETSSKKTNNRVVAIGSPEYKQFLLKLHENCHGTDLKQSVCLLCWGFLSYFHKKKHQEHAYYIVTPCHFKTEAQFIALAKKHAKFFDGSVELFSETLPINIRKTKNFNNNISRDHKNSMQISSNATNQSGHGNSSSSNFNSMPQAQQNAWLYKTTQELRALQDKQKEHEQQLKRLNSVINVLCEEARQKNTQIESMEQLLTGLVEKIKKERESKGVSSDNNNGMDIDLNQSDSTKFSPN